MRPSLHASTSMALNRLLDASGRGTLLRSLLLRGRALAALGRSAAASRVLQRGLTMEPSHGGLREALDAVGRALAGQQRQRAGGPRCQSLAYGAQVGGVRSIAR